MDPLIRSKHSTQFPQQFQQPPFPIVHKLLLENTGTKGELETAAVWVQPDLPRQALCERIAGVQGDLTWPTIHQGPELADGVDHVLWRGCGDVRRQRGSAGDDASQRPKSILQHQGRRQLEHWRANLPCAGTGILRRDVGGPACWPTLVLLRRAGARGWLAKGIPLNASRRLHLR